MSSVYKKAVDSIPSIKPCYHVGLRALGPQSKYVRVSNTSPLNGSVFLDECLKGGAYDANRWDYTFGYKNEAYYLEVHPAGTNEVETVIRKFAWLKNWLKSGGMPLNKINAVDAFHWIASGAVSIVPGSTYDRRLREAGLAIPKSRLSLP